MDITQATRLARSMVCEWGMSPLGTVSYDERSENGAYLGMHNMSEKNYSDETAQLIDAEVRKMIDEGHERALELIRANREKVELTTQMLMEFETLDKEDMQEIINGTWDINKKRARLKAAEELSRKSPAPASTSRDLPRPASDAPQPQGI